MVITNCEYVRTIRNSNGFAIAVYASRDEVELPDGTTTNTFIAKGYILPEQSGVKYNLTGEFEKYTNKNTGDTNYTFAVASSEEVIPDTADAMKAYLMTLKGIGKVMAAKIFNEFTFNVFDVLENSPEKLKKIKGLNDKSIEKITIDYAKRKAARKLFQYLYPFHIKESKIMKLHKRLGENAIEKVKSNPYCITEGNIVSFKTAEKIAEAEGIPKDSPLRVDAAICEVLFQAENGGNLFSKFSKFPDFVYYSFLQPAVYNLLQDEKELYVTGGTYITREVAYLVALKLLNIPLPEDEFNKALVRLKNAKRVIITGDEHETRIYRYHAAKAEGAAATRLAELVSVDAEKFEDIDTVIDVAERKLGLKLSSEQAEAVKMSAENHVSIITGGPGTGKTSVQKVILETFHMLYPNESVLLLAPTGKAAKRMTESTGYPASTLHSALQIHSDEDGSLLLSTEDFYFREKLIIVDEASMIGALLLECLLSHVAEGTHLVLIGDTDQLPSIEIGAVLRELISCGQIPTTRLTKTFRQANGSIIVVNAARIRIGETNLDFNDDFEFIEKKDSTEIAQEVCRQYCELTSKYGEDEVVCLSAFRQRTESGTDALNALIRSTIRKDLTDETPFFEKNNTKIYQGDRVMFRKNLCDHRGLANGDTGKIENIVKNKDGIYVTCNFDGKIVTLEDDEIYYLELAYAVTVHKSQGSEYKAVIMVVDSRHEIMLERNLVYTGATRAKQKLVTVGEKSAFDRAIKTYNAVNRRSQLGNLVIKRIAK